MDAADVKPAGRKALFMDRDGVINVDHAYVHRIDQFDFCERIFDLVRHARALGYAIIVVTNQAGIGRGYYTEDDFQRLTAWMLGEFARRGAAIDAVYHCPDHPEQGIGVHRRESPNRKPNPGMLLQAAAELGLSQADSAMVGDKESDIEAGIRAGVSRAILADHAGRAPQSGEARIAHRGHGDTRADVVVQSLADVCACLQ